MDGVQLPPGDVVEVDVAITPEEIRRDEPAPEDEQALRRYLVYLGAGYAEADRAIAKAADAAEAFDRLHRLLGAAGSRTAVLHFHYGEQARGFAEEKRAEAAHERMAGAYEGLAARIRAEIAIREERVRNLEAALRA